MRSKKKKDVGIMLVIYSCVEERCIFFIDFRSILFPSILYYTVAYFLHCTPLHTTTLFDLLLYISLPHLFTNTRMKRQCSNRSDVKRIRLSKERLLVRLPGEVLDLVLQHLSRVDLLHVSMADRRHRSLVYERIFAEVALHWRDIDAFVKHFKQTDLVKKLRIRCDPTNERETNHGEWNVSLGEVLRRCCQLEEMEIGLLASGRSLKYKDDFPIEYGDKIRKLTLVSHCQDNQSYGEYSDKSLFETTQIRYFRRLECLHLNGFSLGVDKYVTVGDSSSPHGGELPHLREVNLTNCTWSYPENAIDIFKLHAHAPLEHVQLEYTRGAAFVHSERFKSLVTLERRRRDGSAAHAPHARGPESRVYVAGERIL